jgi:adenosylcobinamide kinase/adenosylcobinamide-phosphate guanylyltransferase
MIFIIGGYSQGKTDYANKRFKDAGEHIFYLDEWAKEVFRQEREPLVILKKMVKDDPDLIIISTEIGCGIVPLDEDTRIYRKKLGRLQCEAAGIADEVIRVTCGIGVKIK